MVRILWIPQCIFKQFLGDAPSKISLASKTLWMKMKIRELDIFSSLRCDDVHNHDPSQDKFSTQISKAIIGEFLNIRLLGYTDKLL